MSEVEVLVTAPFPEHLMDKIRSVSPRVEVQQYALPDNAWPEDRTTGADVYYAIHDLPRPEQAPNLRWIQTHWAGINHLRQHAVWDSDITITTASGIHAPNVAEYVMAQLLAWSHRVPRWLHHQRQGQWPSQRWKKFVPDELRGKTLGIAGYGSIGREVARLASAFGMKVLATKRDARHLEDEDYALTNAGDTVGKLATRIYPGEATRSMVAECDYVVIALPLTEKTHHLFDEEVFRAMKPTAFLVNVGRGSIVKEEDLVKALKKGWIAGAGLDVFETEPLAESNSLWDLENVIISPHVAGFTPSYDERVTDLFVENLRRYLAQDPLLNVVNREEGY